MAKRTTSQDKIGLHPAFIIPEGAEDTFVEFPPRNEVGEGEGGLEELDLTGLGIPGNIKVVSQTLRRVNNTELVDVVIEFDEVEGAIGYDSEHVKA